MLMMNAFDACETQEFASHGEVSVCLSAYYSVWILGWTGRETQDFASLL